MPSVRETFAALHNPRTLVKTLDKVLAAPALNKGWREAILEKRNRKAESFPDNAS
jgi:hypothetical protein